MNVERLLTDVFSTSPEWAFVRAVVIIFAITAVIRLMPLPANRQGKRIDRLALIAGTLSVILLASACAAGVSYTRHGEQMKTANPAKAWVSATPATHVLDPVKPYVGVFEPGVLASYDVVRNFSAATGHTSSIALYYSGWNEPFQSQMAGWAQANGAMPFVQILPRGITLANLASGRYDAYLRSYALAVHAYRYPVIIGFAPEMNGGWYSWDARHTPPRVYISAWDHMVTLFRHLGASNVIWLWTINSMNATPAPVRQWWPGSAYVTWVGIDGYYYRSTDTYEKVFGRTIRAVRAFTSKRILISETAIGPGPGQATQIQALLSGIKTDRLLGLVWFDQAQHQGIFHQDWRLEDTPSALAAFRSGVSTLEAPG